MPGTTTLVWTALQPVLVGTAFDDDHSGPPYDDGARGTQVLWCAATRDFVLRHPGVTAAVDTAHPDGCTDLVVDVGTEGRLEDAAMECLDLGDGLVGRPIDDALPELVRRVRDLLH
jgi:hypothetical protein